MTVWLQVVARNRLTHATGQLTIHLTVLPQHTPPLHTVRIKAHKNLIGSETYPLTPQVCLLVGWSVVRSVSHNFLNGQKVSLPCSYRTSCF